MKAKTSAKEIRLGIGADILVSMQEANDLPLPNIHRVAKTMMQYFEQEGYEDDLEEYNYRWRPTEDYWRRHIRDISSTLSIEKNKPFCFCREKGNGFRGSWRFCTKKEYDVFVRRDRTDISTRTDTHNERIDEGKKKWPSLQLPHLAEVPLLSN